MRYRTLKNIVNKIKINECFRTMLKGQLIQNEKIIFDVNINEPNKENNEKTFDAICSIHPNYNGL